MNDSRLKTLASDWWRWRSNQAWEWFNATKMREGKRGFVLECKGCEWMRERPRPKVKNPRKPTTRLGCERLQVASERSQVSQKVQTWDLQALAAWERALASWLLECTSLDVQWASACSLRASARTELCPCHKSGQKCMNLTPTSNDDNSPTVTRFSTNFGHDAHYHVNNIWAKFYDVRTSGRCPSTENWIDARNNFAWLCLNT